MDISGIIHNAKVVPESHSAYRFLPLSTIHNPYHYY